MEWVSVIALISVGVLLVVLEVIFVPGTTVVGIVGALLAVWGIYLGFKYFDTQTGTIITAVTIIIFAGAIAWSFKSKTWEKFALKSELTARANDIAAQKLRIGEKGKTVSALRPSGNAIFEKGIFEVHTNGNFLDADTLVEVIKIEQYKIFVAPAIS